ncbi:MAG: hypothetical protein COA78_15230 [Blastopirellula sp.]|nr:MAG: hypothetical protein COA78_15230 [Blastopirellula sp.]
MTTTTPYHALVKAASSLVDLDTINAWSDRKDVSYEELEAFFQKNRLALDDVRQALSQQCEVPLEYTNSYFAKHLDELQAVRPLARIFSLGIVIASEHEDLALAVRIAVDSLELANASRRGGIVLDFLLGNAIAGTAISDVVDLREKLKEPERKYVITELARIESQQEPLCDIVERDKKWEAESGNNDVETDDLAWDCTDAEYFDWLENNPLQVEVELSEEDKQEMLAAFRSIDHSQKRVPRDLNDDIDKRGVAMLRMLAIDLGIRSFHETHGCYPASLELLKEDFPSASVLDPFTNAPFIYQVESVGEFSLCSAGVGEVQSFSLESSDQLYKAEPEQF